MTSPLLTLVEQAEEMRRLWKMGLNTKQIACLLGLEEFLVWNHKARTDRVVAFKARAG